MQEEARSNGIVQTWHVRGWIFLVFFLFSSFNCLLKFSLVLSFYICFHPPQEARIFARIPARIRIDSHQRWGLPLVLVQWIFSHETYLDWLYQSLETAKGSPEAAAMAVRGGRGPSWVEGWGAPQGVSWEWPRHPPPLDFARELPARTWAASFLCIYFIGCKSKLSK